MKCVWLCGLILLLCALTGCEEVNDHHHRPNREVRTALSCTDESICDFDALECNATFDEVFTTFIDEYGDDFDIHTTIEEQTLTRRHDDIDELATLEASFQTETLTTTTTEKFIDFDLYGHETVSITETTTVTVTTWSIDCPTCPVEVCTSSGNSGEMCTRTAFFPEFPQCSASVI